MVCLVLVGTAYGEDSTSTAPQVVAGANEDLKMSYMGYDDFFGKRVAGKKGKVTGSVQVGNLLPEPLAFARVVLVIDSTLGGGKATAMLDATFDPPIAVGEMGTATVKGVADLSKIHSLDYVSTSMYVDEARGEARPVAFAGQAARGEVTAEIPAATLSAQMVYRGVDGSAAMAATETDWVARYLKESSVPTQTPTYADTLSGPASVTISNASNETIVAAHVGFVTGGVTVPLIGGEQFVRLDPPLDPGDARTVAVAVDARLELTKPAAYFADGAYPASVYDALPAAEPAEVVLQKATPLMDAPKKGAKLAKLARKDTVVELGTPTKGMVEVRAADGVTGWIKASALDTKVTLPGSKKKAKHKGRTTSSGKYLAACDLAKVKGVKVRADPDAYVVTRKAYVVRFVLGAGSAQSVATDGVWKIEPIELAPYGDPKCPFVPADVVADKLYL